MTRHLLVYGWLAALLAASFGSPNNLHAQGLLNLVTVIPVGGTPDAIVVDHSPGHNDVVFYDRSTQRVRFIDAETLTVSPDYLSLGTTQWEGWLVYSRVHHLSYFVGTRTRMPPGEDPWKEVMVHVIENRIKLGEFSVNEPWNSGPGSPSDTYYSIDGMVLKPAFVEDLYGRLIIDNTYGGNLDVVDFDNNGLGYLNRQRGSYRPAMTSSYSTVRGSSIALETNHETLASDDLLGSDLVYIADANHQQGKLRVARIEQSPEPLAMTMLADVDLSTDFMLADGVQGLGVGGPFDRLWVCPGTQSFAAGAFGEVDTVTNTLLGSTALLYGDQYHVLVDWYDQSRAFVCTFDGFYTYDPDLGLHLNLVVNGTVLHTLQLLTDYDEYDGLRGMAFDPYVRRLYLTVGDSIYVVDVDYGPIAPLGEIFADGFESGGTDAWSFTEPG